MINEKNFNIDNPVLIPRASELYQRAEQGIPGAIGFLTPKEQYVLSKIFKSPESGGLMFLWGGCPDSERKTAFFLPDYYLPQNSLEKDNTTSYILEYASDFLTEKITPLRIKGSGYRDLNHRDYLGSILSLGIERDSIGDICIESPHESVIFASSKIAPFILGSV